MIILKRLKSLEVDAMRAHALMSRCNEIQTSRNDGITLGKISVYGTL